MWTYPIQLLWSRKNDNSSAANKTASYGHAQNLPFIFVASFLCCRTRRCPPDANSRRAASRRVASRLASRLAMSTTPLAGVSGSGMRNISATPDTARFLKVGGFAPCAQPIIDLYITRRMGMAICWTTLDRASRALCPRSGTYATHSPWC